MSVLDEQRAEFARTPQAIATLGVRYCANHYATIYKQGILYPERLDDIISFARSGGGVTVDDDTHDAPDGTTITAPFPIRAADTVGFPVVNDFIRNNANFQGLLAPGKAYTFSVWLRTVTGTGTITLRLEDSTNSEGTEATVNLTTTWTRFSVARLFTGGATGSPITKLIRKAGDLATFVGWGWNLTENPGNLGPAYLWPTVHFLTVAEDASKASRCAAADLGDGSRCYYSFATCQDRANFNAGNNYEATPALRGIREYRFCMQRVAHPLPGEDIRPYITGLEWAAQEIDPEKSLTKPERIELRMDEDAGPGLWDPVKSGEGALVNTALEQGSFWRRWQAIHRFYGNPECYGKVSRGFVAAGMTEALYEQRGNYLIANLEISSSGQVTVHLAGRQKLLVQKGPAKISSDNLLDGAINNSVTTITVDDASEFTEPPIDGSYPVTILIETEKMNVTARDLDANTLTVQRGRWGTAAASHANNVAITEIMEFGTERSTPSLTPLGINFIDAVIQLARRGGYSAADVDSATLEAHRDMWFPSTVDTGTGDTTGALARRTVDDPTNYDTLLGELRELLMLNLFTGEDQRLTGSLFAPALPTATLATLADDTNFIKESVSVDDNNESRVTRVVVAWDLINGEKGDEVGDYLSGQVAVEPELEAREGGGEKRWKVILSKWIQAGDNTTAYSSAAHILGRHRNGVRKAKGSVELKDDTVKCGDFVLVTTRKLQKPSGATDTGRQMLVTKKEPRDEGVIDLELIDAIFPGRPGFIAPAGFPDYDAATADQRRFCYIGSAGANRLGTAQEDGNTIW